jgi:hypothetical protein
MSVYVAMGNSGFITCFIRGDSPVGKPDGDRSFPVPAVKTPQFSQYSSVSHKNREGEKRPKINGQLLMNNESEELAFIAEDVKALAKDVCFCFNSRVLNQLFETKISVQG